MKKATNFYPGSCASCAAHVPARGGAYLRGRVLCREALREALWLQYRDGAYSRAQNIAGIPLSLVAWAARAQGVGRPSVGERYGCRG